MEKSCIEMDFKTRKNKRCEDFDKCWDRGGLREDNKCGLPAKRKRQEPVPEGAPPAQADAPEKK
jgi:hypothetical protein